MNYSKYDGLNGKDFLIQFFKDNGITDEEIMYYDAWDCFYNCEKITNDEKGIEYAKGRVQSIISYRDMTLETLREDYDAAPWAWRFKRFEDVPFVTKNELKPGSKSIFLCIYDKKLFLFNVGKEEPTGAVLDDMILNGRWSVYTFSM